MIDEKVLIERLEKARQLAKNDMRVAKENNKHWETDYHYARINAYIEVLGIVEELAEEHNKKYEPTMDLIEHGVEGYIHHLEEQYKKGYAEGWHDCSCTIQQSAPYMPKGE